MIHQDTPGCTNTRQDTPRHTRIHHNTPRHTGIHQHTPGHTWKKVSGESWKERPLQDSHFEKFIRQNKHPACLHFSDKPGVWRVITVRSTRAGHLMAIVVVHPHTLTQEELAELKGDLTSYFSTGAGAAAGLTSLYIQVW
ncbi:hypothetical protein FHG87_012516 [Trinorchestia longiramus]|nr:hypothetical protein FHG87_012516 [Trinorchestia longiramus]